ncbi:MAG: AMP-binding protein, partial [Armatimonadetes bacterium]|nr:AMP-binding protein [Anaerolineae bacterium]
MLDWLAITTAAHPHALALICDDQQWTYAQLNAEVSALGGWLSAQGLMPGQQVGVLLPNSAHYVRLVHALIRLGAVIVPLNLRLTPDELRYQVQMADCALVICDATTAQAASTLPCPLLQIDHYMPSAGSIPPREIDFEAMHAVVFTSGTSGKPKGVVLTYGNHYWGAVASAFRLGMLPDDRWLCCLPLYHVGGLNILLRCSIYGTAVVLKRGFDLVQVKQALATQSITLVSLVPTMLYRLLESE